jgi:hypothetical protein
MKKMMILVLALVMAFAALPAFAQDKADWAFYGSVRMWTAWEMVDNDTPVQLSNSGFFPVATTAAKAITYGTETKDDDELGWLLQGNSRIGANVKWGNVGGRFEYGHSSTANLRLLYGTWNFGAGTLLVGQDYGPYFYLISGLCGPGGQECNGIGFGSIYSGRNPQLKLIFGGLQIALVSPQTTASFQPTTAAVITPNTLLLTNNQTTAGTGFVDIDRTLPKIEASYTFNLGPGQFFIGGAWNQYTEVYNIANSERENDVNGWALGAGTKLAFGPFYANATVQYATNPNQSGTGPATLYPSVQLYNPATDQSEDSDYMAAQLILGFKLTDSMVFEGGVIWQKGEFDSDDISIEQTTWTYYIGFGWSPAKNVFIVPEIGIVDYGKLKGDDEELSYGKMSWVGIKWQINF